MRSITLYSQAQAQQIIARLVEWMTPRLKDGKRLRLSIGEETRSLPQNARMWAMLGELSRQVDWHGQRLAPEEWKDVCTSALKRQKVVPGIDGGFVVLGSSTRKMSKAELSELIDFIQAFGAQQGVKFEDDHAD
jgi:hypothetical protein